MESRESGSSVVWRETARIDIGGVRKEVHAVGRWARRTEKALSRRHYCLDTVEFEWHVVEAAGGWARESTIAYPQRGASNIALEAYCKCPAPEACETAMLRVKDRVRQC